MRRTIITALAAIATVLMVGGLGCNQQGAPTAPAPLTLDGPENLGFIVTATTDRTITADLYFAPPQGQALPRMMELHVALSSNLSYVSGRPLEACNKAKKTLTVQQEATEGGETLRIMIYASTNLNELAAGPLARFVFNRLDGQAGTLTLLDKQPIFAPASANHITLPDPLEVGGGTQ